MKKLFFVILAVVFSTAAFAQQPQTDGTIKVDNQTNDVNTGIHCYMMVNGNMFVCLRTQTVPMTSDVTLHSGIVITTIGQVYLLDGTLYTMIDGDCVDLHGTIGTYDELHPRGR